MSGLGPLPAENPCLIEHVLWEAELTSAYEFLIGRNSTEVRSSRGGKRIQVTSWCEGCQGRVPFVFFCVEVTGGGGQCWARAGQTTEEKRGKVSISQV